MKKTFQVFCLLLALFNLDHFYYSQKLILNEISQGSSGGKEYVELLVVPTGNCHNCIDLREWIIDDNNGFFSGGPSSGVGIAPGAIRFSNNLYWSCISTGTLITIYNDADMNPQIGQIDTLLDDGNCNLIIPISSTLFERHSSTPNNSSSSYSNSGWTQGGDWWSIGMSNSNDSFLTLDPSNPTTIVHSVSWGNNNTNNTIYFNGSASGKVYSFKNQISNDPDNQANWVSELCSTGAETPGQPNNLENSSFIAYLNNNCSSINPNPTTSTSSLTICSSQLPYNWNGLTFNTAGTQTDTLISINGCDSLATLILTVNPQVSNSIYDTICNNQLPYSWNGLTFNAAGTQAITLTSTAGCDSIVTLNLTINSQDTNSIYDTICEGQLPYMWNGMNFNSSGMQIDSSLNANGCDSLTFLNLTVLNNNNYENQTALYVDTSVCVSSLPLVINGYLFEEEGDIKDTLTNIYGCDSIIRCKLSVYNCNLIIPSAFTPDKDLVNDFWEIPNIDMYFPENKVKIYNRWGELLFESEKGKYATNPWDGKHKGKSLGVGSYYYIIQLNEQNQEDKSGSVSIIK
ncbi:MAG: gliding motility-associated C-terminal domain-containing protein [Crocinitomicaceae bacterium]|nr:gliding motility-associated C-terminal domain-containing protein [Crocinitomicaceae bacterium]